MAVLDLAGYSLKDSRGGASDRPGRLGERLEPATSTLAMPFSPRDNQVLTSSGICVTHRILLWGRCEDLTNMKKGVSLDWRTLARLWLRSLVTPALLRAQK